MARSLSVLGLLVLASCATLPTGLPLEPALEGRWVYVEGLPADDPLLDWSAWPDVHIEIDANRGLWSTSSNTGKRTVLPPLARVVGTKAEVLTLEPEGRPGSRFQIYYRFVEGRLEFWWGDHPDWLKPHVTYRRE